MMAIESMDGGDARMDMAALGAALRRRWVRIVLVTVLLLAATYAVLLFIPKSYESTAGILVENRDNAYTQPATATATSANLSPQDLDALISSEIQLIQSPDTLLPVVRTLKLTSLPEFNGADDSPFSALGRLFHHPDTGTAENIALNNLLRHLTVIRQRDSALINVIVDSSDPQLAARLANAIADADVARRAGLALTDTADASQWLDQQVTQLRQRVSDAETKVANFKIANDLYTGSNATSLVDQQMTEVATQITDAQQRRDTALSRASLIRGLLAADQPIDGVDDVRNSVTIQQLLQQKAQLTAQRAQLLATLLPTHPSVTALTAQIKSLDKQIGVEGLRVADALEAEAKIESTLLDSLQNNLNDLKAKEASATRAGVELDSLQRDATADKNLLDNYLSRFGDASARTNDPNSDLPDVRVISVAIPSSTPSSPKITLILAAVAFVSLAGQIGMILFGELLSGRAIVEGERRHVVRAPEPVAPPAEPDEPYDTPAVEPAPAVEESAEAVSAGSEQGLRRWFARRAKPAEPVAAVAEPPLDDEVATDESPAPARPHASADADEAVNARAGQDGSRPGSDEGMADVRGVASLAADLILGRARVVVLAALNNQQDEEALADRLAKEALDHGLSVARVDAGSHRLTVEPGVTDLAADMAGFGDVVYKAAHQQLAEIPWGQLSALDPDSVKPATLIEALSDVYEVVLVMAGSLSRDSSIGLFGKLDARLVLVGSTDAARLEACRSAALRLGYEHIEALALPAWRAEVA
jgi:tyrosine-protein kinase Etk/Wzc